MTAEQQARDLLERMDCVLMEGEDEAGVEWWREPKDMSAGELVELANLIADGRRKDKRIAELEAGHKDPKEAPPGIFRVGVDPGAEVGDRSAEITFQNVGGEKKVVVRGVDFPCEACKKLKGSYLENGWYRCLACGYPSQ
jgi:hypothetical protein